VFVRIFCLCIVTLFACIYVDEQQPVIETMLASLKLVCLLWFVANRTFPRGNMVRSFGTLSVVLRRSSDGREFVVSVSDIDYWPNRHAISGSFSRKCRAVRSSNAVPRGRTLWSIGLLGTGPGESLDAYLPRPVPPIPALPSPERSATVLVPCPSLPTWFRRG